MSNLLIGAVSKKPRSRHKQQKHDPSSSPSSSLCSSPTCYSHVRQQPMTPLCPSHMCGGGAGRCHFLLDSFTNYELSNHRTTKKGHRGHNQSVVYSLSLLLLLRASKNGTSPYSFTWVLADESIRQQDIVDFKGLIQRLCVEGRCDCTNGATGPLCQVTPEGNGFCDTYLVRLRRRRLLREDLCEQQ